MNRCDLPNAEVEPFHQLLTGAQSSIYAFICSLMGGAKDSADVLQDTNLVLWEKSAEFDRSRKFLPWAFQFAYLQVMSFRKKQQRDRLLFDDELVGALAAEFEGNLRDIDGRMSALNQCLGKLDSSHRDLVRQFYEHGRSLAAIGQVIGRTGDAVAAALYRIRKSLSSCVDRALRTEGAQ
jgi:RNA polymerase sigma-70 factor (ECF subfamily)